MGQAGIGFVSFAVARLSVLDTEVLANSWIQGVWRQNVFKGVILADFDGLGWDFRYGWTNERTSQ